MGLLRSGEHHSLSSTKLERSRNLCPPVSNRCRWVNEGKDAVAGCVQMWALCCCQACNHNKRPAPSTLKDMYCPSPVSVITAKPSPSDTCWTLNQEDTAHGSSHQPPTSTGPKVTYRICPICRALHVCRRGARQLLQHLCQLPLVSGQHIWSTASLGTVQSQSITYK